MTGPQATVVSADLVARWWNELALHIREDAPGNANVAINPGRWEMLEDSERDRLREIAHDLLVRLDEVGALDTTRMQKLQPVRRDHTGRRIAAPTTITPAAGPTCDCAQPTRLGIVHGLTHCYAPES